MTSRALWDGMVWGSTQHSRTAHGLVLTMSGGSTSMLRQRTRAAYEVFSFPGAARQAGVLAAHGGAGTGLPHVRCLFADQYGTIGEGSGRVAIDPLGGSSPSRPMSSLLIGEVEDLDIEVGEACRPRSVSVRSYEARRFLREFGWRTLGSMAGSMVPAIHLGTKNASLAEIGTARMRAPGGVLGCWPSLHGSMR